MENNEMSTGKWVLTLFLSQLPMIGFILLIVWALDDTNQTRKNYAKGALILQAIILVSLISFFIFGGLALLGVNF